MILVLLLVLFVGQIVLRQWRKRRTHRYVLFYLLVFDYDGHVPTCFILIFNVRLSTWMNLCLLCMFYALYYYGVLSRDFPEVCHHRILYNRDRQTLLQVCYNVDKRKNMACSLAADEEGVKEYTFRLTCGYEFSKLVYCRQEEDPSLLAPLNGHQLGQEL